MKMNNMKNNRHGEINFSNRYLIYDEQEGYFDGYIFKEPIDITELEKDIAEHKERMRDEGFCASWTLESIEDMIRQKYPVKDVVLFEMEHNANEIMKI